MRSIVDTNDGCDDCTCVGVLVASVLGAVLGYEVDILVGTVV